MVDPDWFTLGIFDSKGLDSKWLVETENSEAPSYSNILYHNGGANRAEHAWRIFQKSFHVFVNISRLRGQILAKSVLDGVKVS